MSAYGWERDLSAVGVMTCQVRAGCKFMGMVAAPDDAYRVLRHIRTLPFRLQTQVCVAVCVAVFGRLLCGGVCAWLAVPSSRGCLLVSMTATRTHAHSQGL